MRPFERERRERELEEEIRTHLRMAVQERIARGASPEEAEWAARREFGNVGRVKEVTRSMWGGVGSWWPDLKVAVRGLVRYPRFALTVALTLGLGIGATTTIYSIVDAVILRPLPYHNPSDLVAVGALPATGPWRSEEANLQELRPMSLRNVRRIQERSRSLESLAAFEPAVTLLPDLGNGSELVPAVRVAPEFFEILGVGPALGRTFLPEEYARGSSVLMVTYGAWQRRFGGDANIVGRPLDTVGRPLTIVGVLPREFRPLEAYYPSDEVPEYYLPVPDRYDPLNPARNARPSASVRVLGRLTPGSTLEMARAELAELAATMSAEFPAENIESDGVPLALGANALHTQTVGPAQRALGIFLGAAGLLLFLAALNAATLLLVRSLDRAREFSVRMALGAGWGRVACLILGEAGLLSLAGGALGAAFAYAGIGAFVRFAPPSIPRLSSITVDVRILAVAALVTVAAGLAAGLLPALTLSRQAPGTRLHSGGHAHSERRSGFRDLLVGGQIAVAVVLLTGAALLFGSFMRIRSADPGFEPDGLVTMSDNIELLARARVMSGQSLEGYGAWQFWNLVVDEVSAVPGVTSVGIANSLPFQSPTWAPRVLVPGDADDTWREGIAGYVITPGYLETMGTAILQGRGFEHQDGPDAEPVALVNETFVRTQMQTRDPVDRIVRITDRGRETPRRIVGVVEDVVQARAEDGARPAIYVPHTQRPGPIVQVAVRTSLPMATIVPELRAAAARFNPLVPSRDQEPMAGRMAATRTTPRFQALLVSSFAVVALLLAATGLYGSLAHSVVRSQRELGVRVALGAGPGGLLRMVLRQGMRLTIAGLLVGLGGALAASRVLTGLLFEVQPHDPVALVGVAAALLLVSGAACLGPARRATRVDPITVLRIE